MKKDLSGRIEYIIDEEKAGDFYSIEIVFYTKGNPVGCYWPMNGRHCDMVSIEEAERYIKNLMPKIERIIEEELEKHPSDINFPRFEIKIERSQESLITFEKLKELANKKRLSTKVKLKKI